MLTKWYVLARVLGAEEGVLIAVGQPREFASHKALLEKGRRKHGAFSGAAIGTVHFH